MVAVPLTCTGCLLCRLLLTTKELPTSIIPFEVIKGHHLMTITKNVMISDACLGSPASSPIELPQHEEIPVMGNLHLCRNNRPSYLPKNKYYLSSLMQSKSNLGQLNTQTKLQNRICTIITLKEKHLKQGFRKRHIFFNRPCYSKPNLTENFMFAWVYAAAMLHKCRTVKFLYLDTFRSDERKQSLIYRMCMNKTNLCQLVIIKHS